MQLNKPKLRLQNPYAVKISIKSQKMQVQSQTFAWNRSVHRKVSKQQTSHFLKIWRKFCPLIYHVSSHLTPQFVSHPLVAIVPTSFVVQCRSIFDSANQILYVNAGHPWTHDRSARLTTAEWRSGGMQLSHVSRWSEGGAVLPDAWCLLCFHGFL